MERGESAGRKHRAVLRRLVVAALVVIALAACLPTWLGFFARWHWRAELATHFTWQYCLVLPLVLGVCLYARRRKLSMLVAATLAWNLIQVAPAFLPAGHPSVQDATPFRVMTLNVFKWNPHHDRVVDLILRESPDVACLMELNWGWLRDLKPLESVYPHRAVQIRGAPSGLALYSKHELEQVEFQKLTGINRYCAVARVKLPQGVVTVLATHPPRPRDERYATLRDGELLAAARLAASTTGPVVLMGDFNTTPWSPVFSDVLSVGDLRDSSRGFGVQPTWRLRNRGPLTLPIDHVLHTPDLSTIGRRVGVDIGSDHRAVIVDLALSPDE